jgi:hypothetical protein
MAGWVVCDVVLGLAYQSLLWNPSQHQTLIPFLLGSLRVGQLEPICVCQWKRDVVGQTEAVPLAVSQSWTLVGPLLRSLAKS